MKRLLSTALLTLCVTSCAVTPKANTLTSEQQAKMENKVLLLANEYRRSKNLPPLLSAETLTRWARSHSLDMQRRGTMDHKGFFQRVSRVRKQFPHTSVSENVGYNYGYSMPEKRMVDSWINSPSHRANLLGKFRYTGIGVTQSAEGKIYFTQLFVSP